MYDEEEFEIAVKTQCKARVALEGPGGSGKTYTALTLAVAWAEAEGGEVVLIDTKRGQSKLYADRFKFRIKILHSYHPDRLAETMVKASGFAVCVVDSMSPFWSGRDGVLEQVDRIGATDRAGAWGGGWKKIKPAENRMIDALFGFPGHLVCTFQVKTDWMVQTGKDGRIEPVKVGLKPDQRNEMEYDFDLVGTMDRDNTLTVTKSRSPDFTHQSYPEPDAEFAMEYHRWLNAGAVAADPAVTAAGLRDEALANYHTAESMMQLYKRVAGLGLLRAGVVDGEGSRVALGDMITSLGIGLRKIEKGA